MVEGRVGDDKVEGSAHKRKVPHIGVHHRRPGSAATDAAGLERPVDGDHRRRPFVQGGHQPTAGDLVKQVRFQHAADRPLWPPSCARRQVHRVGVRAPAVWHLGAVPVGGHPVPVRPGIRAIHSGRNEPPGDGRANSPATAKASGVTRGEDGQLDDNLEAGCGPPGRDRAHDERDDGASSDGVHGGPHAHGPAQHHETPASGERQGRGGDHGGAIGPRMRHYERHRQRGRGEHRPHTQGRRRGAVGRDQHGRGHRNQQHREGCQQERPRQVRRRVEAGSVDQSYDFMCRPGADGDTRQQRHHYP